MMPVSHRLRLLFLLAVIFSASLLAAYPAMARTSCAVSPSGSGSEIISPHRINQGVFNRVLLEEVNHVRCMRGLDPLSESRGARAVAQDHVDWMAASQTLSHESTRRGQRTLRERFENGGIRFRRATENLARISRYRLDRIGRFRINDESACSFSTRDGRPIGAHTYRSLAAYAVDLWEVSPGHARNLFDPDVDRHGAAVAYDPAGAHCGDYYITQTFYR